MAVDVAKRRGLNRRRLRPVGDLFGYGYQWSPLQLPGIALWLRADAGVSTQGGKVKAWADQSLRQHDASQSTENARPGFTEADSNFGGRPTLSFDGIDDYLDLGLPALLDITPNTDAISVFAIAEAAVTWNVFITQSEGSSSAVNNWTIRSNSTGVQFDTIIGGQRAIGSAGDWNAGEATVFGLVSPGGGANFHSYVNGVDLRNKAPGSNAINGTVVVGAHGDASGGFLDGSIGEIGVGLDDWTSWMDRIQRYARERYRIGA